MNSKQEVIDKCLAVSLLSKKISSSNASSMSLLQQQQPANDDDNNNNGGPRQRVKCGAAGRHLMVFKVEKRPNMDNGPTGNSPKRKKFRIKCPPENGVVEYSSSSRRWPFSIVGAKFKMSRDMLLYGFVICLFATFLFISPIPSLIYSKFVDVVCSRLVSFDLEEMKCELDDRVRGQHIANEEIIQSLEEYFDGESFDEPLLLLLHGGRGVGKTFTASIIENHFANQGISVHWYLFHKKRLTDWIIPRLEMCAVTVFILDDVDITEKESVEQLREFLSSFNQDVLILPMRLIFLVTTNYKTEDINHVVVAHFLRRKSLHDLALVSFANLKHEIVTHLNISNLKVVPFLPLDEESVRICIKNTLESFQDFDDDSSENEEIDKIMMNLKFFPDENPVFSKYGCKKLSI